MVNIVVLQRAELEKELSLFVLLKVLPLLVASLGIPEFFQLSRLVDLFRRHNDGVFPRFEQVLRASPRVVIVK